ncbi:ABC-2 type transport system ATP-binding protein [Tenacibaculum sp. 190524A02b]|uniref:ABC-2 type transport system ATP-binding protein n=1 Tax=Tenacibaculum vairaonense TaxID=3137860 RepID=A0ABP1F9F5_9FLAO
MQLEIQNVSKKYTNKKLALKNFSLTINKGILGLLGPNGAGKSTLLKMIATINHPSSGSIILNKNNIVKDANYMRKQLGFLPQDFGVYPNLNAYEFLKYMAAMKGIGGKSLHSKITQLLEGLNLTEAAKRPIGSYSGGMKQRIGIAQALLNNPKVLIFDEPTVGLDPEERIRFRNLINDLASECIVILSSHIVSDIDTVANSVAIMKDGQMLAHNSQEELIKLIANKVFEISIPETEFHSFKMKNIVVDFRKENNNYHIRYISDHNFSGAKSQTPTLEDAYLFLTKTN